jgi:hypothetical protein
VTYSRYYLFLVRIFYNHKRLHYLHLHVDIWIANMEIKRKLKNEKLHVLVLVS